MSEMFKPKQFDSFEKVPDDQKKNFKKEEDGSFVYKEAAKSFSAAKAATKIINIFAKQKITPAEALHVRANKMNAEREKDKSSTRQG
ncbi:MAG TPA: hypothetical protein P5548_02455 [Candidatus Moranbacteria bacterium]|nr:hypothetical protein [Candidatus Moranbacteria bacterium]HRZ33729.1 hypothetical protein [Candidatus Moranbacteria bacterium]